MTNVVENTAKVTVMEEVTIAMTMKKKKIPTTTAIV
jgi:hypothetical protein